MLPCRDHRPAWWRPPRIRATEALLQRRLDRAALADRGIDHPFDAAELRAPIAGAGGPVLQLGALDLLAAHARQQRRRGLREIDETRRQGAARILIHASHL